MLLKWGILSGEKHIKGDIAHFLKLNPIGPCFLSNVKLYILVVAQEAAKLLEVKVVKKI